MFNWKPGRQYETKDLRKLLLFQFKFFDCYLLKIPAKTTIKPHTDKVEGKNHYRVNIILKGSMDFCSNSFKRDAYTLLCIGSVSFFRPDIELHSAFTYKDTLILSIGWVTKKKQIN
jgi:hypothetical protein